MVINEIIVTIVDEQIEELIRKLARKYTEKFKDEAFKAIFQVDYKNKLLYVFIKTESGKIYREVVEID